MKVEEKIIRPEELKKKKLKLLTKTFEIVDFPSMPPALSVAFTSKPKT